MKVTKDKYELPIAVAETVGELARMTGKTRGTIANALSRSRKSGGECQYIKVICE
jgi:hypothetical protein